MDWLERVGGHIYIVDDDEAVRDSVKILLEAHDYRVQAFASGPAFLDDFDGEPDACLILDVNMPGMNGLEVLREVGRKWAGLPVIMITGRSENLDRTQALRRGARDLLEKPFKDTALVQSIERALTRDS